MAAARRDGDRPGGNSAPGYAFLWVLVLVAFIAEHIWWFLAAAGLVALFFVGWAVVRRRRAAREAAAQRAADVGIRVHRRLRKLKFLEWVSAMTD